MKIFNNKQFLENLCRLRDNAKLREKNVQNILWENSRMDNAILVEQALHSFWNIPSSALDVDIEWKDFSITFRIHGIFNSYIFYIHSVAEFRTAQWKSNLINFKFPFDVASDLDDSNTMKLCDLVEASSMLVRQCLIGNDHDWWRKWTPQQTALGNLF